MTNDKRFAVQWYVMSIDSKGAEIVPDVKMHEYLRLGYYVVVGPFVDRDVAEQALRVIEFPLGDSASSEQYIAELETRNRRLERALIGIITALDEGYIVQTRLSSGTDYVIQLAREVLRDGEIDRG